MSTFAVKVRRIAVHPHANADLLELAQVDEYRIVVGKGQFRTGDLVVYIPEQAIVPAPLLEEMGLLGRLAGPQTNRVKAIRLRGEVSQGLAYRPRSWPDDWCEGVDVAEALGIVKWEPPIPIEMAGQVEPFPSGADGFARTYTDIENFQSFPHVLIEGQPVEVTEKLHGTCAIVGILDGVRIASSKGIAARGLVIKEDANNAYWCAALQERLFEAVQSYLERTGETRALLFGEILGVQDLRYGLSNGRIAYRAFDLYVAGPDGPRFLDVAPFAAFCGAHEVPRVPVLYSGPWDREAVRPLLAGASTLASHIREGVVIRPTVEQYDPAVGRLILKWISPDYLTRKGGTEFN